MSELGPDFGKYQELVSAVLAGAVASRSYLPRYCEVCQRQGYTGALCPLALYSG